MKIAISFLLLTAAAFGQASPSFEVVSVKLSDPNARGNYYSFNHAGVSVENGTLSGIIEMAYDVRGFQVAGGPGWIGTDRYQVTAKFSPEDEKALPADGTERTRQMRLRLQAVLAERFQLRIHRETREQPEYSLVVGKNGPKMTEGDASLPQAGISANCGGMKGTRARMATLSVVLSRQLQRPVLDHTNLTGMYDFEMTFTPESGCGSAQPDSGTSVAEAALARPSIFTAIQEQLGLKLESVRGPVEVIVIDRVEKPDPN
jgi:uncharacterized protein (TIGR03435 family)